MLNRSLSRFVNVFLWQSEQAIKRALAVLKVTAAVGIEDSGVHHLGETDALALLDLLETAGVPFLSWLFGDGPVTFLGVGHAKSRVPHVLLADGEGIDVDYLVLQALEAGFFVRASFGFDGQAKKSSDCSTNLVRCQSLVRERLLVIAGVLVLSLR